MDRALSVDRIVETGLIGFRTCYAIIPRKAALIFSESIASACVCLRLSIVFAIDIKVDEAAGDYPHSRAARQP
jgi:hypothetical protein